jgi:polysaccharide export outer membrane protein
MIKSLPTAFLITLLSIFLFSSCVSRKEVSYFQSASPEQELENAEIAKKFIATIQDGDILQIIVSSLSPEASAMFNPYSIVGGNIIQNSQTNNLPPANGYLVNEEGTITLPLVGQLKVEGFSTREVTELITQKLDKFLQQPTVNIHILNFKISVMGEVNRPSVYTIPNETITLPEVLSLAGDLTIFGKRNNIMVIRETNGKREFGRIDLTKRDLFSSPYYYLHANDVVYVEPTKGKVTSSDRTIQLAPIFISGLSLLTVLITTLLK